MKINDITKTIELLEEPADRCIAYAEMILHLKAIRAEYQIREASEDNWKYKLNNRLTISIYNEIDKTIEELKAHINFTVEHK